jgi:hypothetical protein
MMTKNEHELVHAVQSTAALVKLSILATVLAVVVLFSAILPMEYDIDPLGIGKTLGLTPLAEVVSSTQSEQADQELSFREDSVAISIPGGKGLEYKFHLIQGETLRYEWDTQGQEIFFDFHGEPEGDTTGYFESYTVTSADKVRGSLTAPFTGSHGWYWKNESLTPVHVTLMTEGSYKVLGFK